MIIEEEMKEEMKEDVDPHNGADDGKYGTHPVPPLGSPGDMARHPTPGRASPQDAAADPDLDFWSLVARAALPGPTVEKYLPCAWAGAWPCGQHMCG